MATKPTTAEIRTRAERRMRELGYPKPKEGDLSFDIKQRVWDERFAKQLNESALFLTRVYESEQTREDNTAARDQAAYDAQVEQLRTNFMGQPGTTSQDFERALPRLLERQREEATLGGITELERAKQVARASGRYAI